MKIAELADRLDVPVRQVRYLISEGIIPGAEELGRYADGFGEEHVVAGRQYALLQGMGFPPKAIKILLAGGGQAPLLDARPVFVSVDPSVDPSSIDVESTLAAVEEALRLYVGRHAPTDPEPASED